MRKLLERLRIWAIRKLGGYAKTDVPTIQYVHYKPLRFEARVLIRKNDMIYGCKPSEMAAREVLTDILVPKLSRELENQGFFTIGWEDRPDMDGTMFRASVLACREEKM